MREIAFTKPGFQRQSSNNFCRIDQPLRVTPAMEAGVSDHVWSLDEVIGLWTPIVADLILVG
jgi:hypothetical protein